MRRLIYDEWFSVLEYILGTRMENVVNLLSCNSAVVCLEGKCKCSIPFVSPLSLSLSYGASYANSRLQHVDVWISMAVFQPTE